MKTLIRFERLMFLYGMLFMGILALAAVYLPGVFARWGV